MLFSRFDKLTVVSIVAEQSKGEKIRNRYNQVPHLTQDTKPCTYTSIKRRLGSRRKGLK